LPPLRQIADPPASMLLIDDLATSGWHVEEALTALRRLGAAASAFVWITGAVT
jgi:predicted amidophosphoribosyltransferase